MPSVWADFCKWITTTIQPGEVVIVVAYNGPTCNLKWIWKLTQAPNSLYLIPDVMKLFLDPLWAINKYEGCKINPTKSKLDSPEIGAVWKYIKGGENLNRSHYSLVDVMSQTDVLIQESFTPYIDRGFSIQLIHDIFSKRNNQCGIKKCSTINQCMHHGKISILTMT